MKLKKTHTYLGMPSYGSPELETLHCIDQLMIYCMQNNIRLTKEVHSASNVCAVRNNITTNFLANPNFTHCLMVDSDMMFPVESLRVMLELDKDIVGVIYTNKGGKAFGAKKIRPHVVSFEEEGCKMLTSHEGMPFKLNGFVGTGLMLIKRKVLETLPWPHFWAPPEPKNDGGVMGEDALFCKNAVDAGFEVWVEPRLFVGHIGQRIFTKNDAWRSI